MKRVCLHLTGRFYEARAARAFYFHRVFRLKARKYFSRLERFEKDGQTPVAGAYVVGSAGALLAFLGWWLLR